MGLISAEVEVTLNSNNVQYYENLGYEIPKRADRYGKLKWRKGTKITVMVKDLPRGSGVLLDFECDDCKKHFKRNLNAFRLDHETDYNSITSLCRECAYKRNKKVVLIGNVFASISEEEAEARREKYLNMLYDYVTKNGYPNVIDFHSKNNLPCYRTFQSMFKFDNVYELLLHAGIEDTTKLRFFYGVETKEDVVNEIYALRNHLCRDVKYTDFQPNLFNEVTIWHISKHFGTVQQMKSELNMTCCQNSYGSVYKFDDGEICVSTFEKDFSDILRNNGFVYNLTYFRNVKYSSFCNCDSHINCDYKIILPNGDDFYIEIAGMLKNEKTEYIKDLPIKDERKVEYKKTLKYKESLLQLASMKYLIYIPTKENHIEEMKHIFEGVLSGCKKHIA